MPLATFAPEIKFHAVMQDKFIATMTVQELILALSENGYIITRAAPENASPAQERPEVLDFSDSSRFGCGLEAIESRYHVSHPTAQRLKNGILAPAIYQTGRRGKLYVDYLAADAILTEKAWKKKGAK